MCIDLHTHSSISDGTDTPTGLVAQAYGCGLDVIALTDHDTTDGFAEAMDAGRIFGVHVVPGLEISASYDGVVVHLLGYGIDRETGELGDELARIRRSRANRIPIIVGKLREAGIDISVEDVASDKAASSLGRPHIADALIARGIVASRDEAFTRLLNPGCPGYAPKAAIDLFRAVDLVHQAGGVAVLAHPAIRSAAKIVDGNLLKALVDQVGLDGIEVDYPLHSQSDRDALSAAAVRLGLIRTGASDYHGTGKVNHDLGCQTTRPSAWARLRTAIVERGGNPGRSG